LEAEAMPSMAGEYTAAHHIRQVRGFWNFLQGRRYDFLHFLMKKNGN
jgi:hypothetical protein